MVQDSGRTKEGCTDQCHSSSPRCRAQGGPCAHQSFVICSSSLCFSSSVYISVRFPPKPKAKSELTRFSFFKATRINTGVAEKCDVQFKKSTCHKLESPEKQGLSGRLWAFRMTCGPAHGALSVLLVQVGRPTLVWAAPFYGLNLNWITVKIASSAATKGACSLFDIRDELLELLL